MSAVERIGRQPGENGPGERPCDDVTRVVDPGVHTRVGDGAARPCRGIEATGSTRPTPVAKAKAVAEWPEGNEVETGILVCRANGNLIGDAVRSPAAPQGLQDEVDDGSRYPNRHQTAPSRPPASPPADRRQGSRSREPELGVIGGAGEPGHRCVECGSRRPRDRGVDGKVDSLGFTKPRASSVGFCGGRVQVLVIL